VIITFYLLFALVQAKKTRLNSIALGKFIECLYIFHFTWSLKQDLETDGGYVVICSIGGEEKVYKRSRVLPQTTQESKAVLKPIYPHKSKNLKVIQDHTLSL
jgi:hypothetical protein